MSIFVCVTKDAASHMINDIIRARTAVLRKQKGLTQEALAERLGMSIRNYKRLEGGQKKIFGLDMLESVSGALKEPLASLFESGEMRKAAPGE